MTHCDVIGEVINSVYFAVLACPTVNCFIPLTQQDAEGHVFVFVTNKT